MIWFTSDTHFGHGRIIKFCNRPYNDVVDMDIDIINRWNRLIAPNDIVYHLGDFSFYKDKSINETILNQLAGEKHLIIGNHDGSSVTNVSGWASVQNYLEITIQSKRIVLFHYPMVDWNGRFHGNWHLYGHVHARYNPPLNDRAMDVGIDQNNMNPFSFETVRQKLENGWQGPSGWAKDNSLQ